MSFGFSDTLYIVLGLLLVCVPAFILVKAKILKEEFIPQLAKFILYGCQPFLMISCFSNSSFDISFAKDIIYTIVLSLVLYIIFLYFTKITFLSNHEFKLQKQKSNSRVYTMAVTFGNVGFMGIPIIKALLNSDPTSLMLVAFVLVVFNIMSFTVGVYVITGEKKYISAKKALLNPTMVGLYVGIILFLTNTQLPTFLKNPIVMLGDVSITLSLALLGMRLATIKITSLFSDMKVFSACLMKLVLMPIIMYLLCYYLNVANIVRVVLVVTSAMPTASLVLMFSEVYNQDKIAASKSILLSTLLSAITIPLILLIL